MVSVTVTVTSDLTVRLVCDDPQPGAWWRAGYGGVPDRMVGRTPTTIDRWAPLNTPIAYYWSGTGGVTEADPVTVTASTPILSSTLHSGSLPVVVHALQDMQREAGSKIHTVIGRDDQVVSVAPMRLPQGTLVLRAETAAQRAELDALIAPGDPLILRAPCTSAVPDMTISVTSARWTLVDGNTPSGPARLEMPFVQVTADPAAWPAPPSWTWADVEATYASWAEVEDVYASWAELEAGPQGDAVPDVSAPSTWPGPGTTGVPEGVTLTVLTDGNRPYPGDTIDPATGRLIITTANAVYEGWQFSRRVEVRATGVRFTNCRFAGATVMPQNTALLLIQSGDRSAVCVRCEFTPDVPQIGVDAVRGSNVVLEGCRIHQTQDGVHVFGAIGNRLDPYAGRVTVSGCWLGPFTKFDDGTSFGTHCDAVQIVGGKDVIIVGNRIDGVISNAAVQVTQAQQDVTGLVVSGNWVGSDSVTGINIDDSKGTAAVTATVAGNTFRRAAQKYAMVFSARTEAVALVAGNTWHDGTVPGPVVL